MAKNKLLLIDLNEEKTKKISEIISSDTSRKILDYLADKDATEKELAEKLQMPISTAHYHLQKLKEAQLVVVEEFHYSPKGREVNHYKLANKYIIIAPKKVSGIKRALNNILPVGLVILGISAVIKFVQSFASAPVLAGSLEKAAAPTMDNAIYAAEEAAVQTLGAAPERAMDAVNLTAQKAAETVPIVANQPDIALWFLIGAFAAMLIYLIVSMIKEGLKR